MLRARHKLGLEAFGEKEENQEKREPIESCNPQSKVRWDYHSLILGSIILKQV